MAVTYHFYLREDKARDNGECPVYLRITENRKSKYSSTGVWLKPSWWNSEKERVRNVKELRNSKAIQAKLDKKKERAQKIEAELSRFDKDSAKAIQTRLKKQQTGDFFDLADAYKEQLKAQKRHYALKTTKVVLKKLKGYVGSRSLPLKQIDAKFLEGFEAYLKNKYDNRSTTINKNFEPIKAVIKMALKDHLIGIDPFIDFDGAKRGKPKPKTKLNISQIRAIENLEPEGGSDIWHVRNYFLFSFYSGGIRFGDLCCLKWKNIKEDRLAYRMNKNEKEFAVSLNQHQLRILFHYVNGTQVAFSKWQSPKDYFLNKSYIINGEISAILTNAINYHAQKKPNEFIFPILNNHDDYSDPMYLRKQIGSKNVLINRELKELAKAVNKKLKKDKSDTPKIEDVSFHVARHSFAQHAVESGLGTYELMQTLRHSKIETTQKYLKGLDQELADKAMSKVF